MRRKSYRLELDNRIPEKGENSCFHLTMMIPTIGNSLCIYPSMDEWKYIRKNGSKFLYDVSFYDDKSLKLVKNKCSRIRIMIDDDSSIRLTDRLLEESRQYEFTYGDMMYGMVEKMRHRNRYKLSGNLFLN